MSCWRKLCCACARSDDQDYSTLKDRGSTSVINYRNRRKGKSRQKGTWTRRSLLVHEDFDYEGIVLEDKGNQMRMVHGPTHNGTNASNPVSQHHQRISAMDVFSGVASDISVNHTTIPNWMDENFVPNGRTATHLGISSVQINSRRNEIIRRRSQDLTTQAYRHSTVGTGVSTQGSSASSLLSNRNSVIHEHQTNNTSNEVQNNISPRTSTTSQGNASTKPSHVVPRPTSLTYVPRSATVTKPGEKQFHFRESQSDVGVRRIVPNTPGYRRSNPVPRLEDFTGGNLGNLQVSHIPADDTDGQTSQYRDQDSDIFASNITFKKSDVSLKRVNDPAVYSSNSFNNKQQKPKIPFKSRSNPISKSKHHDIKSVESMYGYVPKIVRNVHASTALEGNQIDDFFMQRMHDRELEKFASINQGEQDSNTNKTAKPQIKQDSATHVNKQNKQDTVDASVQHNNATNQNPVHVVAEPTIANTNESSRTDTVGVKETPVVNINANITGTQGPSPANSDKTKSEETEEQIIMIDFPPNLEKDKPKTFFNHVDLLQNDPSRNPSVEHSKPINNTVTKDENHNDSHEFPPKPLTPVKTPTERPRITMGITRSKAASRSDSDASRRSTQTTVSSILESAEVLY